MHANRPKEGPSVIEHQKAQIAIGGGVRVSDRLLAQLSEKDGRVQGSNKQRRHFLFAVAKQIAS